MNKFRSRDWTLFNETEKQVEPLNQMWMTYKDIIQKIGNTGNSVLADFQ